MKKLIALFLCLSLMAGLVPAVAENAAAHEITGSEFPFFYDGEEKPGTELTLYFLDGANDLPYIEANDLLALLTNVYHNTVDFSMAADGSGLYPHQCRYLLQSHCPDGIHQYPSVNLRETHPFAPGDPLRREFQ